MRDIERDLSAIDGALDAAIADVSPDDLARYVRAAVERSNPNPALLATLAGRRADAVSPSSAVGVQLLHTGLSLTRDVVDDPAAWSDAGTAVADEDMELLAADVLVTQAFDRLIDHYDAATRVVTVFGSAKARADRAAPDAAVAHETEPYVATYRAAVEIGADGEPPEALAALAEALGRRDCLRGSRAAIDAADAEGVGGDVLAAVEEALAAADVSQDYREALLADASWRGQRPRAAESVD